MLLKNRVAIVTGATQGVGRAIAEAFAKEGAIVYIIGRNMDNGLEVERAICQTGAEAHFIKSDVSVTSDVDHVFDTVMKDQGRIDILVNNAAISYRTTLDKMKEDEWDKLINVNLKSVYLYSHRAIPIMANQKKGVILNMGSVTALVGVNEFPAYAAAKAGMLALTRGIAMDHSHQGIRSVIICPGGIKTKLTEWEYASAADPIEAQRKSIESYPLKRLAEPEEIADLAVFLASDKAAFITGVPISIDGGFTTH